MPFIPELFSAPALARIEERRHARLTNVPFFDGLLTGEIDALVGSFVDGPEVHQPMRGRIKGAAAFERFVTDTTTWMAESNVIVEDIDSILTPERAIDELMLHVDGDAGPIDLPMSLAADLGPDAHMTELRIYFSRWPLSGVRGVRPPLLQPDPNLQAPDIVGEYHRALAAGDVDAVVEAFEPEGYVREPSGGAATHRGTNELRAFYELLIFDRGVMPFELCAVADDGRACALEYNMAARGQPESAPGAGIAVHVRGDGGKLAAVRSYDDVHPPLDRRTNTQRRSR
jgi:hypothetical protein